MFLKRFLSCYIGKICKYLNEFRCGVNLLFRYGILFVYGYFFFFNFLFNNKIFIIGIEKKNLLILRVFDFLFVLIVFCKFVVFRVIL